MKKNPIAELVSNHAEMCIGEMCVQEKHFVALDFIGEALKIAIDRVFEKITAQDYVEVFAVMTLFDHVLHQREFEISTDSIFHTCCFLCRDDSEQYIDYIAGLLNSTQIESQQQ